MKIGLRTGHSPNCIGAVGIVNEYNEMNKFYPYVRNLLTRYGHTVIDCNSKGTSASTELTEGVNKANNAGVDLFISLHMNAFNGSGNGTECVVSSSASKAIGRAQKICNNMASLGFKNRGIKYDSKLYECKAVKAPNIIFEICFCDSQTDINIYNKLSWEQLAHALCNGIDSNIPASPVSQSTTGEKYYVVTNYLPAAYSGYKGVDIDSILNKYFAGVKCYTLGNEKGIWIETGYLSQSKCNELKSALGSLFYAIEKG